MQSPNMPSNIRLIPVLCFTVFFSVINGTMFNIAIPNISSQFNLLPSQVSWVVTGYTVFFALSAIIFSKLADIFPVKNLITVGLILFNIGSLLGFLSEWYPMLLMARYIQASGAGSIPALAMLIATRYFPIDKRGKVLGAHASTVAFGSGIGPVLGGFITSVLNWHYLFLLSLLSLISIYYYRKWLPTETQTGGSLDIKGAIIFALFVTSMLIAVNQFIWQLIPLIAILGWIFIRRIRRIEHPFIQPKLFNNILYRNALIATFFAAGCMFSILFMIPIMLGDLNQLSSSQIGLVMFPGAMSAALMGFISGRLADKKGSIPVAYIGLGMLAFGFFLLSTFSGYTAFVITLVLIVIYISFAFIQSSMSNTVSKTLARESTGVGMGLYNLVFFISGGFTSAIAGKALDYTEINFAINPFLINNTAAMYSNVSFVNLLLTASAFVLFYLTFRKDHNEKTATRI